MEDAARPAATGDNIIRPVFDGRIKINNPFWIDTLKALSQLFDNINIESTNIAECPIFHNNNIHISAKSFYLKKLFNAGIHCIGDILDINRCFLTLDQINTKYNISANYLPLYTDKKCH